MIHDPANAAAAASPSDTKLRGLLGSMSVFTTIMTVPQVLAIYGLVIKQRGFRSYRGVRILLPPFSGYGSESGNMTGISICRAWVGLHSTVP